MRSLDRSRPSLGRRQFLAAAAAAVAWVATACGKGGDSSAETTSTTSRAEPSADSGATDPTGTAGGALRPADFEALGTCVLLPAMTAGPFPTIEQLDRRDITEGYPGRPLRLGLRVVDEACAPIPDVAVEVWHADASGDYSAYGDGGTGKDEGAGTTFLRGAQTAGANGIVEFATIYPGWYAGRAVHIHVRVHDGSQLVLTSQLFFPDARNLEVLATGAYAEFGPPDTTNDTDAFGGDIATNGSLLHVTTTGAGNEPAVLALVNLGVGAKT